MGDCYTVIVMILQAKKAEFHLKKILGLKKRKEKSTLYRI